MEISKIFRDRESKPLDTAVWWVEHLLQHSVTAEVFHSYAVDLNWFVYYSLDAIAILMGILTLVILLTKSFWKLILSRRAIKKYDKLKQN